ncbi:MAG TPA: 4Fe-4S dicluster domain-containing protein [Thermoanaerobaculia bacterium]|nr:4Fe-4S dicluster domain-containing protein [Thermoanaerobaculia bacterium]
MLATQPNALLIDITRCIGCGECVGACLVAHDLPGTADDVKGLSDKALTALAEKDDLYIRQLCRHCVDPACASVCPVEAFAKLPNGAVVYDADRCMGCRYCMQACPFNVPKYEWFSANPRVVKCDFCAHRQAEGKVTACTEACPADATNFGTREEMLALARQRMAEDPDAYYPEIYGEHEVGGTSVFFLSPVPFEELGFRTDLPATALPHLTGAALAKVPGIVTIGGAFLFGVWWLTHRREEVARYEANLGQERHDA